MISTITARHYRPGAYVASGLVALTLLSLYWLYAAFPAAAAIARWPVTTSGWIILVLLGNVCWVTMIGSIAIICLKTKRSFEIISAGVFSALAFAPFLNLVALSIISY